MGYDHHTVDYVTKKTRKEKVLNLIEKGRWEAVLQEYEVHMVKIELA